MSSPRSAASASSRWARSSAPASTTSATPAATTARAPGGPGATSRPGPPRRFRAGGLEFKAIGTAIRAPGVPPVSAWPSRGGRPKRPFTSDLSGQDFTKLIMKGWVPAGLALGISIGSRHDDWLTVGQTRWGAGNAEVVGYTELV